MPADDLAPEELQLKSKKPASARARVLIHARVAQAAVDWADKYTNPSGPTRADVIRAMLSVAASHPDEVARKVATVIAVDRIGP